MTQQVRQTRDFTHQLVTIVANTCESAPIDVRAYSTMQVHVPAAWTAAALSAKVSPVEDTVFTPLYVQPYRHTEPIVRPQVCSVTVNTTYQFDQGVAGSGFLRLWSEDGVGGDEDQAADRILGVSLKG